MQPRRHLGLKRSNVSLPLSEMMSLWQVTKPRWNAIWRQSKKKVTKRCRPLAIEVEEKSKYISREKTRLQQLTEDIEKAKSVLEARAVSLQREEGRLAELRAECRQMWTSTRQKSKIWSARNSSSSVCWQSTVVQFRLLRNRKLFKTFKPRSRRNVAGEVGNSLHLCVISWNVARKPLDDLDVWLQQVSDHFLGI